MKRIDLLHNEAKPRDRQKERLLRMTQVLGSFASGFTLRPVSVKLVQGGQAPAFSSSDRIWFNESQVADLTTKQGVASLKGLTLHEISHILLSPRAGTEFRQWIVDAKLHRAWNSLEDQRIESQLIALYPSIKDWFVATMSEYLLKTPQQWRLAFPLIHGRKYLDPKVRGIVRKAFKHSDRVAELSRIIDEYRTLNFTNDEDIETAKVLIEQYHDLTKDLTLENPHGHDHRSETEQETNVNSRTLPKKKQTEASDKVEGEEPEDELDDSIYDDFDWDSLDEEDEPDEADEDDEQSTSTESRPENSSDEDDWDDEDDDLDWEGNEPDEDDWDDEPNGEQPTPNGDSTDDDIDGTPTDETPEDSEPNTNSGGAGAGGSAREELENALNEALDQSLERLDDKLANDINLYNGDILLEGEVLPDPPTHSKMRVQSVSASAVQSAEQFTDELKKLRAEYDPAWNRRVENGRINPVRWEQGCELEEAFDRFDIGRSDATDIEAVVLLDISGSMENEAVSAHESMWAIKTALDNIQASTSVVAYNDEYWYSSEGGTFTLYSSTERAGQMMNFIHPDNGTNPTKALQYAQGVLANSNRAIKLLIVITDGEWNSACLETTENTIRAMRDGGVLTSLAWLYKGNLDLAQQNLHGAEIVSHVRDASDLLHLGRSIVEVGIQRQLTR
jgi:hypothetical protein